MISRSEVEGHVFYVRESIVPPVVVSAFQTDYKRSIGRNSNVSMKRSWDPIRSLSSLQLTTNRKHENNVLRRTRTTEVPV